MAVDVSDFPVEQWEVAKLIPYENNNKKHPESQVKTLAASIEENGVEAPIAIEEDGTIISGHGRRLALILLGRTYAPVRVFRGITKVQANKLRIAANKTTSNDYDTDALSRELKSLIDEGMSLEGLGLTDKETQVLLEDIGEIDMGTMSEDIAGDVENHEKEVGNAAAKAEGALVSVSKAFADALGVKQIEAPIARLLPQFIGVLEAKYGQNAITAFAEHMMEVVDGAR